MDFKNIIENALHEAIGEAKEERENKNFERVPIGTVDEETRKAYKNFRINKQKLDDDLEVRADQLEREARRKLAAEFDDRAEDIENQHKSLWNDIYKQLGIDKNDDTNFSFNHRTGEVTKKVKKDPFNFFN